MNSKQKTSAASAAVGLGACLILDSILLGAVSGLGMYVWLRKQG